MPYLRTRRYGGSNLTQYRYVQEKYGKNSRAQVFWSTIGLVALFVGGLVALQFSETDAESKDRIRRDEEFYVRVACKLGNRVCAFAQEDSRRVKCNLLGEDCSPGN